MLAAWRGSTGFVVELVKAGANLDLQDNVINYCQTGDRQVLVTQFGDSALITAAWCGHTNVVVRLVKAGAKFGLQTKVGSSTFNHSQVAHLTCTI